MSIKTNLHLLYVLVGVMALVPVVNGAIGILQTYETTRVGQLVMQDLRNRLYAHLETLPLSFFTNTKTGEIQSRLANDVGGVQTVVTTTASTILANVVTFVYIVAMIIGWQLTIVAVITVPAFFWLTKTVGERRRQVSRSTQESLAAMSAISEETLSVSGVAPMATSWRTEQCGHAVQAIAGLVSGLHPPPVRAREWFGRRPSGARIRQSPGIAALARRRCGRVRAGQFADGHLVCTSVPRSTLPSPAAVRLRYQSGLVGAPALVAKT